MKKMEFPLLCMPALSLRALQFASRVEIPTSSHRSQTRAAGHTGMLR